MFATQTASSPGNQAHLVTNGASMLTVVMVVPTLRVSLTFQPRSVLMTTAEFIIALFYRIDNQMLDVPKHPQASLYPSEVVTLGVLYALKGGGKRAFYRWLVRDWQAWFPRLPSRPRLFRLFAAHAEWTDRFRAELTTLGVVDSYGIELRHPVRQGRAQHAIGKKGLSNHRWIVGGKLCMIVNQWGRIVDWDWNTA